MDRYELIVMWYDGMQDTFLFKSKEAAETAERGFKKAFGGQAVFTCVNKLSSSIITPRGSRE